MAHINISKLGVSISTGGNYSVSPGSVSMSSASKMTTVEILLKLGYTNRNAFHWLDIFTGSDLSL